ncbi:MAG: DUF192 domain-containing protein, partial [Hyphomicrobiaceae bacterium]
STPPAHADSALEPLVIETAGGRHTVMVEVAETDQQKAMGLMFRHSVPPGTGMLFPYRVEQEITMWMHNTYVSLDMIFLRQDGRVHRIARGTVPMSREIVASEGPAAAVLEVAAGEADRLGIRPGNIVYFRSFGNQLTGGATTK